MGQQSLEKPEHVAQTQGTSIVQMYLHQSDFRLFFWITLRVYVTTPKLAGDESP